MKKLIAITVMIALCVAAAFADTTISGAVETRLTVFKGQFGDYGKLYKNKYPKFTTNGEVGTAWFQMTATNSEGTMGGTFRLRGQDIDNTTRWHKVNVWWKPIPQLKVFLGQDADGMFERGQLTSWAFHQGSEGFLVVHNWDFWRCIFPGNFDTMGVALSFYLVDGLELNLVAPIGKPDGWPRHRDTDYKASHEWDVIWPSSLQLLGGYQIGDIGKVHFAWIGRGSWTENNPGAFRFYDEGHAWNKFTKTYGTVHLSFFSGMIQGLQFQVGASMDIQNTGKADVNKNGTVEDNEYVVQKDETNPIFTGAAVHFSAGDFGIKWRLGLQIETKTVQPKGGKFESEKDGGYFLTTNVMPTYKIPALGTVCLDIGFSLIQPGKEVETVAGVDKAKAPDAEYGFWLNPYLKKSINGGYVQAGILYQYNTSGSGVIRKNDASHDKPTISFPVLMGMNF